MHYGFMPQIQEKLVKQLGPNTGEACKTTWWDQYNSGRYKNHCFYVPAAGICKEIR